MFLAHVWPMEIAWRAGVIISYNTEKSDISRPTLSAAEASIATGCRLIRSCKCGGKDQIFECMPHDENRSILATVYRTVHLLWFPISSSSSSMVRWFPLVKINVCCFLNAGQIPTIPINMGWGAKVLMTYLANTTVAFAA